MEMGLQAIETILSWLSVQQYYADGGELGSMMIILGLKLAFGLLIFLMTATVTMWFLLPWLVYATNKKLNRLITSLRLSHLYLDSVDQSLSEANKRGDPHEEQHTNNPT